MLESPKSSVRYDACEELRVASSLPDRAVASLQKTLGDPDQLVADAAMRALALHKPDPPKVSPTPTPTSPPPDSTDASTSPRPHGSGDWQPKEITSLLEQILLQQERQTRLLGDVSTAARLFALLILVSIIIDACTALTPGF
jgi:hypothetical protein